MAEINGDNHNDSLFGIEATDPAMSYGEYVAKASFKLKNTFNSNGSKNAERAGLLQENPNLRIVVQAGPLREIINFIDFRCNPSSSVARNEAIAGSDIDGGIVITEDKQQIGKEIAFIEELRKQGFDAYHQREVADIKKRLEEYKTQEWRNRL